MNIIVVILILIHYEPGILKANDVVRHYAKHI